MEFLAGIAAKLLSSTVIQPLLGAGVDLYKSKLTAENNTDKILADVAARELTLDMRQRELDTQMNISDQGNWFTRTPRALVMWSLALWISKCVFWDKVMGWGTTDPITDPLIAGSFKLIIAMWFGGRTLEKITTSVTNRIGKK